MRDARKSASRITHHASQSRIDGFALQGQRSEDALMDAAQRLAAGEAFQRLDAERELAHGEGAFGAETTAAQAVEVARLGILRAVDDAQVLTPAALHRGLDDATRAATDEIERLHYH